VVISLGRGLPLFSSGLPEGIGRGTRALSLALLQAGVAVPLPVTRECGGLLPHLFTLARTRDTSSLAAGGLFSVALSRGYPLRVLPGALPCGARTFLPRAKSPRATTS